MALQQLILCKAIFIAQDSEGISSAIKMHYRAGCACRASGDLAVMQPRASTGSRKRDLFLCLYVIGDDFYPFR